MHVHPIYIQGLLTALVCQHTFRLQAEVALQVALLVVAAARRLKCSPMGVSRSMPHKWTPTYYHPYQKASYKGPLVFGNTHVRKIQIDFGNYT